MSGSNIPVVRAISWYVLSQLRQDFLDFAARENGLEPSSLEVGSVEWLEDLYARRLDINDSGPNGLRSAKPKLQVGRLEKDSSGEFKIANGQNETRFTKALGAIESVRVDLELRLLLLEEVEEQEKFLETLLPRAKKRVLIDAINEATSSVARDNGLRELLDARDIGSEVTFRSFLSWDMAYWRNYLLAQARQTINQLAFTSWKPISNKFHAPTLADRYLIYIFEKIKANQTAQIKDEFISDLEQYLYNNPTAYLDLARYFYAGDMRKTYVNVSAVSKMTGQPIPDGWQKFQGTTTECSKLRDENGGMDESRRVSILAGLPQGKLTTNFRAVCAMSGFELPDKRIARSTARQ